MANNSFDLVVNNKSYNITYRNPTALEPARAHERAQENLARFIREKGPVSKKSVGKYDNITFEVTPISTEAFISSHTNLIDVHKSIIEKIVDFFSDFVAWVTRNPRIEKIHPLELTFAMHLFRQVDSKLFSKITGSGSSELENILNLKLDSDETFKLWEHFFKEMADYLPKADRDEAKKMVSVLSQINQMRDKINELRQIRKASERVAARDEYAQLLNENLTRDLNEGKTVYLPGGFLYPGNVPGVGSGLAEAKMIYEIKSGDDSQNYQIRVLDFSGEVPFDTHAQPDTLVWSKVMELVDSGLKGMKVSSSYEGKMRKIDLAEFLRTNLTCQIGPENLLKDLKPTFWNLIKAGVNTLRGIGVDEVVGTTRQEMFKSGAQRLWLEDIPDTQTKKRTFIEPEKLMELFMKRMNPEFYNRSKTLMKVCAFQILFNKAEHKLHDEDIRGWLRSNAHSLLATIKKHATTIKPEEFQEVKTALETIVAKINGTRARQVPPAPSQQKSQATSFNDPLRISSYFAPLDAFKKRSLSKSLSNVQVPSMDNRPALLKWMENRVKACKALAKSGSYEHLDYQLQDAYQVLGLMFAQNNLNLSQDESKRWSTTARDLGFLTTQCSYGQRRSVPLPHQIHQIVLSLRIAENLFQKADAHKNPVREGFAIHLNYVRQVLKNPYLNTGIYSRSIFDNLDAMNNSNYPAELVTTGDTVSGNAERLYLEYGEKGHQDIGQLKILSTELTNLRQIYILSEALLAPTRTFIVQGGDNYLGTARHVIEDLNLEELFAGNVTVGDIEEKVFKANIKQILEKLSTNVGELEVRHAKTVAFGELFVLDPYDLGMRDFEFGAGIDSRSRTSIKHPPLYDANGIVIEQQEVKDRLFEQVVAVKNLRHADNNGNNAELRPVERYKNFGVNGFTQQTIIRDKLCLMGMPSDISQEFQLMMSGDNTRFKEVIGKLTKHAGLLNDLPFGPILQRLFATQLFKKEFLEKSGIEFLDQLKKTAQNMEDIHAYRSFMFIMDIVSTLEINFPQSEQLNNLTTELRNRCSGYLNLAIQGKEPYAQYQHEFLRYYLLDVARDFEKQAKVSPKRPEITPEAFQDIFIKYFNYSAQQGDVKFEEPAQESRIRYMIHKLMPQAAIMLKDRNLCNALCSRIAQEIAKLNPHAHQAWEPADRSGLVFKSGQISIDFRNGQVLISNIRKSVIPESVFHHPSAKSMMDMFESNGVKLADLKTIVSSVYPIKKDSVEGLLFEFSVEVGVPKTLKTFRLIQVNDGSLRLYRKEPRRFLSDKWYQFVPNLTEEEKTIQKSLTKITSYLFSAGVKENFPRELSKYECWIRSNRTEMLCEAKGKVKYQATLDGSEKPNIVSIKEVSKNKKVKNPWKDPAFKIFTEIEDEAHIIASGINKVDSVRYNRVGLNYHWDEAKRVWISKEFSGYHLSSKSLNEVAGNADHPLATAFPKNFTHYQVLESNFGHPKVVVTCNEYVADTNAQDNIMFNLVKNTNRFVPNYDVDKSSERPLFVFNVDPNKGLVLPKETPADQVRDAYLYLAYVMMIHGKYLESLEYLRKSDMNIASNELTTLLMSWINKRFITDDTAEGKAIRMHVVLMQMRHGQVLNPKAEQTDANQKLCAFAAGFYMQYRNLVKNNSVPAGLRLNDVERLEFKRICEKSLYYVAFKIFTKKDILEPLLEDFKKIEGKLRAIQNLRNRDAEQFVLLAALWKTIVESRNIPSYKKLYELVFEKLHFSIEELYEWYKIGGFDNSQQLQNGNVDSILAIIDLENKHQIRLKSSYRSEIKSHQTKIEAKSRNLAPPPAVHDDKFKAPLLPVNPFVEYFKDVNVPPEREISWRDRLAQFNGLVQPDLASYDGVLQKDLAEDLKFHLKDSGRISSHDQNEAQVTPSEKRLRPEKTKALVASIKAQQTQLNAKALEHKRELQKYFIAPNQNNDWQQLFEKAKELNLHWQDLLFNTALRCFGEQDWSLLDKYLDKNHADLSNKLNVSVQNYLQASISEQQLSFALTQLHKLENAVAKREVDSELFIIEHDIYSALNRQWGYNPNNDPDRFAFLLVEYELGIVCRKNQVQIVRETLRDHDQFKQESCGGGKTSVLRVAISKLRSDGVTLSAISTLDSLRKEHGPLFARSTLHAYGEKSFEFRFSRSTPSDEASLLKLHRNLLASIVEGGRLDLTKGDLLSFKLEQILKQERIRELLKKDPNSPDLAKINEELDVMENIRDTLAQYVKINADELDKDCDPTQEKLYAHGERVSLTENKILAQIEFFDIASRADERSPNLQAFFQAMRRNEQSDLNSNTLLKAREEAISILFESYKDVLKINDSHKDLFRMYFTELNSEGRAISGADLEKINQFYKDFIHVKNSSQESRVIFEKLNYMHEFLVDLMLHASRKVGGVNFIRSDDRVHVIPSEGSDKPKNGSEHGLESEQICYTLMDYLDSSRDGISIEQIAQLVNDQKKKAQNELNKLRKLHPERTWELKNTPTARDFKRKFRKALTKITYKDYQDLSRRMNERPQDILRFIQEWVFPEYQMNTEKIISDSQDPPSMVKEYSGSSGTDSSKYALPDQINSKNVSQAGTHGEIIKSLIQLETQAERSIYVTRQGRTADEFAQQLARSMKGGDCLSEVGVFFRGIPADKIALMIWEHKDKDPNIVMRFQDRQDKWRMLKEGKIVDVDDSIPLKNIITIFDDVHTRGSERPSTQGVTEYITLDENTEWSRFEQGALRERGVTKQKANIIYIISPGLAEKWKNEPMFEKSFILLTTNETKTLKTINLKAEKQRIVAITRHQVEKASRNMTRLDREQGSHSHYMARALVYENTRDAFVRKLNSSPESAGAPRGLCTPDESLNKLIQKELDNLNGNILNMQIPRGQEKYLSNFMKDVAFAGAKLEAKLETETTENRKAAGLHPRLDSKFFPELIPNRTEDLDNEQAVEQELTQELTQEQEQETSTEGGAKLPEIEYLALGIKDHSKLKEAIFSNGLNINVYPLHLFADFQDPNIRFTENFSAVNRDLVRNVKPWGVLKPGEKPRPDQNRISRFVVGVDFSTRRVGALITSLKDNDIEIEPILEKEAAVDEMRYSMYNLDTDSIDSGVAWDQIPPTLKKDYKLAVIGVKFQNGQVNYSKLDEPNHIEDQYDLLVEWIRSRNVGINELEKTFLKFISNNRISTKYEGSDLQRAFAQVRSGK